MKSNHKNRVHFTDQMVLIGFGIAAVYWVLDSIMSIFLSQKGYFLERMIGFDMSDIWTRLVVLCLFIIFGSHAQFTINERKAMAKRLERDRRTRERFQRLLSPDLAEMVVSGELKVEKGGQSRVATVVFIDIRGFTAMSENAPPPEVLLMLNEYFEMVVESVFRYEGTVDKFMGDEIMLIWGAPLTHEDDPIRAVRAALEIKTELVKFNHQRMSENKEEISIGIGINTGSLVAGYIGSTQAMSYSVIGDSVNTAARLCAAAKKGQILISENTLNQLGDGFEIAEIEPLQAKGKFNPIRVYNVIGLKKFPPADENGSHNNIPKSL
ncbi:MAG: adenylate/guanylate cyclase domain-containing protein [Desulfobacterales bacterium]|jgi:adenylate cyclase